MRKKKPRMTASSAKPMSFAEANIASAKKVRPRPITKLVLLPVWFITMLTSDRPVIHQNQRAADWTDGFAAAISRRVGATAAGVGTMAESVMGTPSVCGLDRAWNGIGL